MSQLVETSRKIEKLNLKKEKFKKPIVLSSKIHTSFDHYIALVDQEEFVDGVLDESNYMSVNLAELKP